MQFPEFFRRLTENKPFPYQRTLGEGRWPTLLDVPTGLGKTAAVVVAWLYKRLRADPDTGRRLVYCLPMRALVEQTTDAAETWCKRAAPLFETEGRTAPGVHKLLGGDVAQDWDQAPEHPAILVGTQDMLLSRALNRGYAMSRYRWPVHFSLLNSDCLWVFDETQLMGVGVETSAQLEGLRRSFGTSRVARSMWMSATLGRDQLATVDHREPGGGWVTCTLGDADRDSALVRQRTGAKKRINKAPLEPLTTKEEQAYVAALAARAAALHAERKGLTLVVVNRVHRAQDIHAALRKQLGADARIGLVHSRFRAPDRQRQEALLTGSGDRVVVATQAVEAGIDVSATTLLTELAPWPSLVQRFGRCNRYGELQAGHIEWLDLDSEKAGAHLPYDIEQLGRARDLLTELEGRGDAGPATLAEIDYTPPRVIRPVLRRRDLLELFDTTPDLSGDDLDVSRFVRDDSDSDVQIYWRNFDASSGPPESFAPPSRGELCRVSLGAFGKKFLDRLDKQKKKAKPELRAAWCAWEWNALDQRWSEVRRARPGQVVLLHADAGGYDVERGVSTELLGTSTVPPVAAEAAETAQDAIDADIATDIGRWIGLTEHLGHVEAEARALAADLDLPGDQIDDTGVAGRWHDVGKAHPEFQRRLLEPVAQGKAEGPGQDGLWAKSNHSVRVETTRPHFRHELASALAFLAQGSAPSPARKSLIAYLVAAHHGKVRLSIRSLPGEQGPADDPERLFARGVWHGDELPELALPDGSAVPACALDLSPMRLGEGSWLDQMLRLRDAPELGPFRLALLETVVRVADWRASEKERRGGY